jgi:hypothetical protein
MKDDAHPAMPLSYKTFRMNVASGGQLLKSWANGLGKDTAAEWPSRP